MSVRAKFKVGSIARDHQMVSDGFNEKGVQKWKDGEVHTITMRPVYGNGDPNHENTKFWQASPSGELKLGVINEEIARHFELGKEYYIDFTPAE